MNQYSGLPKLSLVLPDESSDQQLQKKDAAPTYFVYSSLPQPVWGRPKFRNNVANARGIHDYYNVMWDPRVRRGDPLKKIKTKKEMHECLKRKPPKPRVILVEEKVIIPTTPPPVEGRVNCDSQTERYLENLEGPVTRATIRTQTETSQQVDLDPYFVATILGEDKGTQLDPGELFNFDIEVQPIIETLVGKVVEQGLLECMEEEELACLKDQQSKFEENRRVEQIRLQRLEEREKLLNEERERLMRETERQQLWESDSEERIGAAAFASIYLSHSSRNAIRTLRDDGFLNSRSRISSTLLPWLKPKVANALDYQFLARSLLDDIIQYMAKSGPENNINDCEPQSKPEAELEEEEEEEEGEQDE